MMMNPSTETERYYYVFYGDVPSILMAQVACRRVGRQNSHVLHGRKVIRCPYCTEVFTDVDRNTKVELFRYPARKHIQCQTYPVCQNCGNEVGMIIVAS